MNISLKKKKEFKSSLNYIARTSKTKQIKTLKTKKQNQNKTKQKIQELEMCFSGRE
jgi:hypothetical protein